MISSATSIRWRLLRNLLLLSGFVVVSLTTVYLHLFWDQRDAFTDDELANLVARIGQSARRDAGGAVQFDLPDDILAAIQSDGLQVVVLGPTLDEALLDLPVGARARLPITPLARWQRVYMVVDSLAGESGPRMHTVLATVVSPAGPIRVAATRPVGSRQEVWRWLAGVARQILPVVLLALMLTMVITLVTVRSAFRPLRAAADRAHRIRPGNSAERLAVDVPSEIRPLVDAVNNALDRLDVGFVEQRRFTANAAHELRTPVAVLRARVDTLVDRAIAEPILNDVDRIARLIDQLLAVSRLDSRLPVVSQATDLASVAADVVARLAPLAVAARKEIALEAPDGPVMVWSNGEMLAAAIRNLAENALRFTPVGQATEIVVTTGPAIEVHDGGPGVAIEDRGRLFERFWRGGDRRGGAGLGLAIVREIATQLDGTVEVGTSRLGGAVFRLRLPPATAGARSG